MSCSRCLAAHELEDGTLECRRHPPVVVTIELMQHVDIGGPIKISTELQSAWPRVKPTDHCADHIHKV